MFKNYITFSIEKLETYLTYLINNLKFFNLYVNMIVSGMVAGRQMSTTSGEFIVGNIEKEIMDYINEQIAILPDPDLKRKKVRNSNGN